jgi:hypothetical protein
MATLAVLVGVALVAVGLGGYLGTGGHTPHALIPALIGVLLAGSGFLARQERLRMHAMHFGVLVALLGALGCLRGVFQLPGLLTGTGNVPAVAVIEQCVTFILCVAFVVTAVRSFIAARRARTGPS